MTDGLGSLDRRLLERELSRMRAELDRLRGYPLCVSRKRELRKKIKRRERALRRINEAGGR
jgi:hypothetical protein